MASRSLKVGTALMLFTVMIVASTAVVEMRYLRDIADAYTICDLLGSGSYGVVYRAHPIQDPNMLVAIKEITIYNKYDTRHKSEELFQTTIGAANEIPGIPRVYDLVKTKRKRKFYVVMQLFIVGDPISRAPVTPALVTSIIRRLFKTAKILKELHDHNVLHNDIASRNVLFDNDDNVMVIDFGVSQCRNSRSCKHATEGLLCRCCPWQDGVLSDSYALSSLAEIWHLRLSFQRHDPTVLKKLYRFVNLTSQDNEPTAWSCEKLLENLDEFELDDGELDLNMTEGSTNLKYLYRPDDVVAATKNHPVD